METQYSKIYTGSFVIVQLLVDRLGQVGITPIIKDESESGRLAGFPVGMNGSQDIFVHNDELDKAKATIEEALSEMDV